MICIASSNLSLANAICNYHDTMNWGSKLTYYLMSIIHINDQVAYDTRYASNTERLIFYFKWLPYTSLSNNENTAQIHNEMTADVCHK